jgi:hypothetical protein
MGNVRPLSSLFYYGSVTTAKLICLAEQDVGQQHRGI